MIFVFGSNLAGDHSNGVSLYALRNYGAKRREGIGHFNKSYALPVKGLYMEVLPLEIIQGYVDQFISYAKTQPKLQFAVTKVGCGIDGYTDRDMAPMFTRCPNNCILHEDWVKIIYRMSKL